MRVNAEVRGWCERASGCSAVRSLGFLANPVLLLPSATRRPIAVLPTVGVLTPLLTPLNVQYAETSSNHQQKNGLDKPILQRDATPRNGCRRIVAPEDAGSTPVGHSQPQARVPETSISSTIFVEPGSEGQIGAGCTREAALASMFTGVPFLLSAIVILATVGGVSAPHRVSMALYRWGRGCIPAQ
jgi:hypothetical protein